MSVGMWDSREKAIEIQEDGDSGGGDGNRRDVV